MSLLAPLQLLWLSLLVPLVVLYILKRRRNERRVGSTLLWEAALRDMRAERPWKRLIPHLSLILQVLAIIAGAVALARPTGAVTVPGGTSMAVVIDTSASMAAVDAGGRSRLELARDAATDLARALPPGSRMMLIEAAAEPVVIAAATDDTLSLARTLSSVAVSGGAADLEAAVALAVERMRGAPSGSRVVVLTDAAQDGSIALDASVPVEVRRVGETLDNTGITAVDVRARGDASPDRADIFVRVARFADSPRDVFVTASVEGGGVVASRRITVPANGTESLVLPADLPPDARGRPAVVRVDLSRPGSEGRGLGDALALDDVAVAPSPGGRRLPVFMVGRAPAAVERVLRADEGVELFATTLSALAEREEQAPLDGLVIYTGELPEQPPPGDSMVIAPAGEAVFGLPLGEEARSPRVVTWDEEHALLRFVTLSDVHLASVRPIRGAGAEALVTTDEGPVVALLRRPAGETTVLSFDPTRGDWPAQPSFVIFFRNLIERARDHRAAGGVAPGRLGEALRVPAPDGEEVVAITPSGDRVTARSRGGLAAVPVPAEPGVYRVEAAGREIFALRNLLLAGESNLTPRLEVTRGGEVATGELSEPDVLYEAWPWLAGALLLILAVEAWWATRRPGRREARA